LQVDIHDEKDIDHSPMKKSNNLSIKKSNLNNSDNSPMTRSISIGGAVIFKRGKSIYYE
jgi:hypothetical protein